MFTAPSFTVFRDAYNDAFRVLSNVWAPQEEVDAAYDALVAAKDDLVQLPPAVFLRDVIILGEVSEQFPDRFTPASHANLIAALDAARALEASSGTFDDYYWAARNLMDAIRALRSV